MKRFKKLKKSLTKKQRKELASQIQFLRTAMVSSMTTIISDVYERFTDNNGWIPAYDTMIEICDKVLFNKDSEFLVYFEKFFEVEGTDRESEIWEYWEDKHDTCYDWFFMDKANKLLKKELKSWETERVNKFDKVIETLKANEVDGEMIEYVVRGVNLEEQLLKQLMVTASELDIQNNLEERTR